MDKMIRVQLARILSTLLVQVNPNKYDKFIAYKKGIPVIHLKLKKALYCNLQVVFFLCKYLTRTLKYWVFEINPYNKVFVNKNIDGSQCTIMCHADNLKISHVDSKVDYDIINMLNIKYGKEALLAFTWGKVHEYVGLMIYFSSKGKVII